MKIAIEGCAHGELEKIYETISFLEQKESLKVDLLICCGDFQSTRNCQDLECLAAPAKYRSMCSFYKYYSGEKEAPILTLFIGGNHEASNYLSELAYGGWVAPNIYYLGYAGVIKVAGIRIAGLSGIYKGRDYKLGHFEKAPFTSSTMRSVYHIRNLEVFRLKQLSGKIDIALSHDWPRGIYHHGNKAQLLRFKPFFEDDIKSNSLGSQPAEELLHHLKPSYWFSAHLHCKFSALVQHVSEDGEPTESTKFLALDKCLPRRRFLQVLEIPHEKGKDISLEYDLEWLTILSLTNHLLSTKETYTYMPGPGSNARWKFTPTQEEMDFIEKKFLGVLKIPLNFSPTVEAFNPSYQTGGRFYQPTAQLNPQTMVFCEKLGLSDPIAVLLEAEGNVVSWKCEANSSITINPVNRPPTEECSDSQPEGRACKSTSDSVNQKTSLQGMKLPTPKFITSSILNLPPPTSAGTELQSGALLESSVSETDSNLDSVLSEPSAENPIIESTVPSSFNTTEDSGNQGPLSKKFKRRNQAFYLSVNDDD